MLNDELLKDIIREMRDEFHIPLYFPDSSLIAKAKEGDSELHRFSSAIDYAHDFTVRSFLKNYIYYAYFGRTNEFFINYADSIVSWQFSQLKDETDTNV